MSDTTPLDQLYRAMIDDDEFLRVQHCEDSLVLEGVTDAAHVFNYCDENASFQYGVSRKGRGTYEVFHR